jgi:hypothetical protein
MTTRPTTRRPRAGRQAFSRAGYERELAEFMAELGEAYFAALSGQRDELGAEAIYDRHAALFERSAIDALRAAAKGGDAAARQARAMLAFAVEGHLQRAVADLTDAIEAAEARAIIVWRGERIGYRAAPIRIAEITHRGERNALDASYQDAVDAINPMRLARLERLRAEMAMLGYADEVALIRELHGVDVDALATDLRQFLAESETVYFAALGRVVRPAPDDADHVRHARRPGHRPRRAAERHTGSGTASQQVAASLCGARPRPAGRAPGGAAARGP